LILRSGTVCDATLISEPSSSSTKNRIGERDPEVCQTKNGNNG